MQRKDAKRLRDENISVYVKESLGKPLEKVQNFFDAIQGTIANNRGIKPEEISFQQQFSRVELKKVGGVCFYLGEHVMFRLFLSIRPRK